MVGCALAARLLDILIISTAGNHIGCPYLGTRPGLLCDASTFLVDRVGDRLLLRDNLAGALV